MQVAHAALRVARLISVLVTGPPSALAASTTGGGPDLSPPQRLEQSRDTAVATATAEIKAAERLITELRKLLDDARRPWWRQWLDQGGSR
jgi:hypothetical protein